MNAEAELESAHIWPTSVSGRITYNMVEMAVADAKAYLRAKNPRLEVIEHAITAAFWLLGDGADAIEAMMGRRGRELASAMAMAARSRLRTEHSCECRDILGEPFRLAA